MVQLSAICVQKPLLAFQQAKLAYEKELMASGLSYSIVRPTAFFKSLSGQVERVRQGKPFLVFGDGTLTACKPISDDDLGNYLADCLDDPARQQRILPIGGPGPGDHTAPAGRAAVPAAGPAAALQAGAGGDAGHDHRGAGRGRPRAARRRGQGRPGTHRPLLRHRIDAGIESVTTGRYDADATPSTGTQTLADHYAALLRGSAVHENWRPRGVLARCLYRTLKETAPMTTTQFQVRKDQLATTRLVDLPDTPLAEGQVRVRHRPLRLHLQQHHLRGLRRRDELLAVLPRAADADGTAWGCIPVWGFADVVQSLHPGVAVGERLYGYWPMATHAVLQPTRLSSDAGFSDGSAAPRHAARRLQQLPALQQRPVLHRRQRSRAGLLRPLFSTAWLIDDFLADNSFFGSTAGGRRAVMLLSSASSKTAYATAAHLAQRPEIEVVGLTSAGNVAFCQSLGIYSRVLTYDQLDQLPADTPCVYVDFAGNGACARPSMHALHATGLQLLDRRHARERTGRRA